jgi:ferredoxin-NADP reductase
MSALFESIGLRPIPAWDAETDDELIVRQVIQETHDVKTFIFCTKEPRAFRFVPGQFITLELPVDGEIIHRCYTIATSPTRPYLIAITVKRVEGGPVSNWLHDNLKVGDAIRVSAPLGSFSFVHHPARKYLFLSGGSGITPMMSMTRALFDLADEADLVFVHNARTPLDIIYRAELELMASRLSNVRVVFVCDGDGSGPAWPGFRGRLTLPMLELIAPDFREREIFVCGPSPYMAAVRGMLTTAGFDMAHYHEESFDFEDHANPPDLFVAELPVQPSEVLYRVEFTKSHKTILCNAETNILDAARASGIRLPSSCRRGMCGTCKSRKLAGEVALEHAGGIRQREIDQGMLLLCCSKPRSDLVIER